MIKVGKFVARMGKSRGVFKIITGKDTGKRHLERPISKENIKPDLKEISLDMMS
jgi:hypothetical protein